MPAYEGEQFIAQAVGSVLGQTFRDLELVVVDDGSTDRTAEIIRGLQQSDRRIRYLRQDNSGQAAARNLGISNAGGNLIAFLDQDDLWVESKLQQQVRSIDETGVDLVFSSGDVFSEAGAAREFDSFPQMKGVYSGESMFHLLFAQNRIPILSVLVRKDALDRVGLLDENLRYQNTDDYDLWLRMAAGGANFLASPDKLVKYRAHGAQASGDKIKMIKAEMAVLLKHEGNGLLSYEEKAQRFRSIGQLLICAQLAEGRIDEALTCFRAVVARYTPIISRQTQAVLLRLWPSGYTSIMSLAHRIQQSFGYRIGRPARRLLGLPGGRIEAGPVG
jgi:glycosyltransferase involved in cell wall biosynthesis